MHLMKNWRGIIRHSKAISGMLIVALVFLTVLPFQVHFHHVEADSEHDSKVHEHIVDVHFINANLDASHDEDGHLLDTSPDGLKVDVKFSPFLLFVLLIGIVALAVNNSRFKPTIQHLLRRRLYYHQYPPLRGPPH